MANQAARILGIAAFFLLMAFAAVINILEETGITRDIYLISPLFILLFGPVTYLSAKLVIEKHLPAREAWHFLPAVPLLFFTSSYIHEVIAVGPCGGWAMPFLLYH